jgi:tetratricopeptide (TPR) repeat protein
MKFMFNSPNAPRPAPPDRSAPANAPRFLVWMLGAVLVLGTVVLYWPVTHHEFVIFDDRVYVSANDHVQQGLTLGNLKWACLTTVCSNWHPLTMLSHMLDCQLYGLDAGKHHLTNLLLHALDSALLLLVLHRLTGAIWRSAAVAALFAVHPLHVESVAWVAERKDVLSACFGFLTLYFYAQYARPRETKGTGVSREIQPPAPRVSSSTYYWLAWFALALGLMSKPMLVTWPFVMLLLDFWPLGRLDTRTWRALVIEKIPGFALVIVGSVITYAVQAGTGATGAMTGMPMIMRFNNAVVSYGRYVLKLIWPRDLAVFYPHPGSLPPNWVALAAIFLCAASACAWITRKSHPYVFTGWFWFVGTLVPVIGLVQVGAQAMADRYMYLPSVGLFMVAVWGLGELSRGWRFQAPILSCAGVLAVALCAVLTRQQLAYWQNSETLFRHARSVTADNVVARANLALVLCEQNRIDAAVDQFKDVARMQPDYVEARNELGNLLAQQGHTNEAMAELQEVIRRKPDFPGAHCSLGRLLADSGRTDEAFAQYHESLRLKPDYPDAHYCLGHLLAARGQTDAAIAEFQAAERGNGSGAQVYYELGNLLSQKNRIDEAIQQYQTAIRLKPDFADAHNQLGRLLATTGRAGDAVAEFQAAVRAQPDDFEARNNWANVLAMQGQHDAAAAQFQEVIRLKPDYADAHFNFGNFLAGTGQTGAAITEFQEAVRLSPGDPEAHYKLGNLLVKQGQAVDAIHQFQEAIRLKPDYMDAHFNLGSTYLKAGQSDDSIIQFQSVTNLAPNLPQGHCLLGMALAAKGRQADAINEYQEAIRLKPDYAMAQNKLGSALQAASRLDDAISHFQEAVRLRPDYAEANTNLARAQALKGARPGQ